MAIKLLKLENEVFSPLCEQCKCCLASTSHCWTCHSTIPIEKLCDCGTCKAKADDYIERLKTFVRINNIRKARMND